MTEPLKLLISVDAEDAGTASRQAQALLRILQEAGPPAQLERIRESSETLDGGATIAVILASPVLLELARALRVFLQRHNGSSISISGGDIVATNVSAATIADLTRKWAETRDGSAR